MKEFIKEIYKSLYKEDLIKTETIYIEKKPPVIEKTKGEKLLDFALTFYNVDPTPLDAQPDDFACVESLTTILRKYLKDFPIMTYTPLLLKQLQSDIRFKASNEFKVGNIIISVTKTGNGKIVGHTGILGRNGKILSNASSSGLFTDKYDNMSWIERYSRQGQLALYIFELI